MGQLFAITPFTMLDFPGETACVAWLAGCNMRCVYCHNPEIVREKGDKDEAELLAFLEKRRGLLTGVVFSGGEATLCPSLPSLARRARALGYKVKLDTNGTRPDVLADLWVEGVLDYVALDYKTVPSRAQELTGTAKFQKAFRSSLAHLIECAAQGLGFEVRTTFHADLMEEEELAWIIADLDQAGFQGTYYIQNIFAHGEDTLGKVAKPSRMLDVTRLPRPRNFRLALRNFPDGLLLDEPDEAGSLAALAGKRLGAG